MSLAFVHFNVVPHEIEHSVMRKSAKWAGRRELCYWVLYPVLFCVGVGMKLELLALAASFESEPHFLTERRLASMNAEWTEFAVVGWMGASMALAQLLLLGLEVAQWREEMWETRDAR